MDERAGIPNCEPCFLMCLPREHSILPLFIFDGPKYLKVKRGRKISGEGRGLIDSMKGIEVFGSGWGMVRLFVVVSCPSAQCWVLLFEGLGRQKPGRPT